MPPMLGVGISKIEHKDLFDSSGNSAQRELS